MAHERPNAHRNLIRPIGLLTGGVVLIFLGPDRKLLLILTFRARRRTKSAPDTSTEGKLLSPTFN